MQTGIPLCSHSFLKPDKPKQTNSGKIIRLRLGVQFEGFQVWIESEALNAWNNLHCMFQNYTLGYFVVTLCSAPSCNTPGSVTCNKLVTATNDE